MKAFAVKTDFHMGGGVLQPASLTLRAEQEKPGGIALVCGFKYLASEKSREPVGGDAAQALATCPDSAVAIRIGTTDMDNAIAIDNNHLTMNDTARTLSGDHESLVTDTGTSIVQTFCKNERAGGSGLGVSTEGVMYTETACDNKHHAVAVRTANTHANGHGVADEATHTLDRASGQAVAVGFKAGQSANGGLGIEEEVCPTQSHQPSALEPTVAIGCDRYNQTGSEELIQTLRTNCGAGDGAPTIAVGVDAYNKTTTGEVSKTLGSAAADTDHTPCAMLKIRSGKDRYVKPDGTIGSGGKGPLVGENQAFTLSTVQDQTLCLSHIVRRLTPIECERLQGFPDDWTKVPWRTYQEATRKGISYESLLAERGMRLREPTTEDCPDSPRYKALGNSMATNCVEWVLRRIVAAYRLGMID